MGRMAFSLSNVGMQTCYQKGWIHRISLRKEDLEPEFQSKHSPQDYPFAVLPSRLHEK
jgi:hypothetical protein